MKRLAALLMALVIIFAFAAAALAAETMTQSDADKYIKESDKKVKEMAGENLQVLTEIGDNVYFVTFGWEGMAIASYMNDDEWEEVTDLTLSLSKMINNETDEIYTCVVMLFDIGKKGDTFMYGAVNGNEATEILKNIMDE